jgi:hypothetical protein
MANLDGLDSTSLIRRAIALIAIALIGIISTIDASAQFSIFSLVGAWFVCLSGLFYSPWQAR